MIAGARISFDWRLVRSFLAALDHGSLLAAARALHTSQPTLGRHIAELESQLGVVLFERTGRGLVPTNVALTLADAARGTAQGADQLARTVTGAQADNAGTVRISASTPVAVHVLPRILAHMRQALPDIQVELVASNTVSNLLRREADIAVRTDDLIVQWEAVRAGLGVGFVAHYMARCDADVVQVLPDVLRIAPLPMWLVVHREIRTSRLIRAVVDFLAGALPDAI